jgi:hypothetical protein
MWVGKATVFLVGLSVILAMVLGLASAAFSATGGNFVLGQSNSANGPTTLVGQIVDTTKSVLVLKNPKGGSALQLQVNSGKAPLKVNATAGIATNLNVDKLDGQDSNAFLGANAKAADSDKLDGKDVGELAGTVVQMRPVSGDVTGKTADFSTLRFITNPVTVTTTSTQQITGVVSAPLKTNTSIADMNYGLCYREAGTNDPLVLFFGGNDTVQATVTTTTQTWTTAQTKAPGLAGSWDVGFCAANSSNNAATIAGEGKASGWIEVVNPTS